MAVTSIIGTVILQNGSPENYIRLYGQPIYNLIKVFNIDDMYHAWWFLFLIVLLCINIVVCSIERLSSTWKIIFPKQIKFNPDRFRKIKNLTSFNHSTDTDQLTKTYESYLEKKVGTTLKVTTDTSIALYAEKGRWTRIGIYFVHASILLLLVGALIGSVFGFKANLNLDEGETSDTAFLAKKRTPVNLGFSIRCNDFDVKFYDTGAPEEFKSNLTIIEDGKESFTKDIRVNHPLRYKGINIFQSSYGTAQPGGATFEIIQLSNNKTENRSVNIGEEIKLADNMGQFKLEGFLPHFDFKGNNLGEAFVGSITPKEGESFQIALPVKFPTFDKMRKGNLAFVVKKFENKHYTGLQITKDPGIWFVYSGFILMIIGCWVTFFMSHQSYFIEIKKDATQGSIVSLSGTTNRNSQGMNLKIKKVTSLLKDM